MSTLCAWCGDVAPAGLVDDDGDPQCLVCARAEDTGSLPAKRALDARRYPGAAPADAAQCVAIVRPRRERGPIETQTASWLRARGWDAVKITGREALAWRRLDLPGLARPVSIRRAVAVEHALSTGARVA